MGAGHLDRRRELGGEVVGVWGACLLKRIVFDFFFEAVVEVG